MATTNQDVEMTDTQDTHKGKGVPNPKPGTTAHFEQKAQAAAEAESLVCKALGSEEMDIDLETDGEIFLSRRP